jgi:HK97 family phage major capsid protein
MRDDARQYAMSIRESSAARSAEVRANSASSEDELHARDLETAQIIQSAMGYESGAVKPVSQRSAAIHRVANAQPDPDSRRFRDWLRTGEARFAGEQSNSTGGFLVKPAFAADVIRLAKEYDGLFGDMEFYPTDHGSPMVRPGVQSFTAGVSNPTEGTQVPITGNDATFTQVSYSNQSFAEAYNIVVNLVVSNQLVADSGDDIETLIAENAAENIGRQLGPLCYSGSGTAAPLGIIPALNAAGAWSAGNSGGYLQLGAATAIQFQSGAATTELAGNVLAPQTMTAAVAAIDTAYLKNAKWYMNGAQWANVCNLADNQKRPLAAFTGLEKSLLGFPVVLSSAIGNLAASTTGGPIFGDLSRAHTIRTVNPGISMKVLREKYADSLQTAYLVYLRVDARARDTRAAITVKPATT